MHLSDLRIGHMETQAKVPAGGVSCSVPVTKTPSVKRVTVGNAFATTFTVTNPYDCTLSNVRLEDVITTKDAARFDITSTTPAASSVTGSLDHGNITWNDIGDLAPHTSRTLAASFMARGGVGQIIDRATASGTLTGCADPGATIAGVDVGVLGAGIDGTSATVRVPTAVTTRVLAKTSGRLPFTGAPILFFVAAALVLIATGSAALMQANRLR
jgi:hypothetical protein